MKFVLDANMPHSAKKLFSSPDTVAHVRDLGMADASDDEIIARAVREGAILITRDLDFANTVLHPINTHAGAVVLRVPPYFTAQEITKVLKQFLSVADRGLLSGFLTIVEPGRYRTRGQEEKKA